MNEKLQQFGRLLEAEQLSQLIADGCDCAANRANRAVAIKPGIKYTKVNVGTSGKYMVDNTTGEIFGIKGYGQVHKGHQYGTLDTIAEYYWGDYQARKIDNISANS